MSDTAAPHPATPNLAIPQALARNVCCYDLAGLPPTGLCPKSATPVASSRQSQLLLDANRGHVSGLCTGSR